MSRGCYKAYGRKINGPAGHTSIQFDKLFCENSNKPTASKSTGTVGKWGITSFTSIRSSKFTIGLSSCKRQKEKKDSYGTTAITPPPEPPKPKKFFKSRAAAEDAPGKAAKSFHVPAKSPRAPQSPPSPPPPRSYSKQDIKPITNRPVRQASLAAAKKLVDIPDPEFDEEYDEDMFDSSQIDAVRVPVLMPPLSAHPPTPPEVDTNDAAVREDQTEIKDDAAPPSPPHPPIVLRIFKGTAQLVGAGDGSSGSVGSEPVKEERHSRKENRRRSHGSDSGDCVSPKRHKSKHKDTAEVKMPAPVPPPMIEDAEQKDTKEELNNEIAEDVEMKLATIEPVEEPPVKIEEPPVPEAIQNPVKTGVVTEEDRAKLLRVLLDDDADNVSEPEPPIKEEEKEQQEVVAEIEAEVAEPAEPVKEEPSGEDVCNDWVATNYVPPPEIKENNHSHEAKVEPIVLRRPSAGSTPRPPKKGSIFKSRGGEKRNARYIHNWSDQKDEAAQKPKQVASKVFNETEFDNEVLTRVTLRDNHKQDEDDNSITSITCSKKAKEYYTVVRNVKKVHQLQESGEFQEFNDDVEYILDALKDNNPISTRCLSAITLASKCMSPEFRMHVRAHGTVTKFFRALHDATKDQRLGMCTATVMFVLSQDRLNMDIDRDSLELMLNLLESDASHSSALEGCGLSDAELAKTKDRVRSLCQEIQEQGHAKHLNLDNITVGQLAMETLLSLTCKRAGEWFKEELRDLGGLEHIIKTVVETSRPVISNIVDWTPQLLDRLKKADRCLKVLENVTFQNEENNNYLLTYGEGILVDTVVRVFRVCDQQLMYYPTINSKDKESTGAVIRECLIANLKVLIHLTHDYGNKSFGSTLAGKKDGVIETSLHILLEIPNYVPEEQKFDVTVLALILLINLVEHSECNRKLLISSNVPLCSNSVYSDATAVSALVGMFLQQEELARTEERKTDAILDGEEKPPTKQEQKKSTEDNMEETVQLLLQKAGRHMEHTLVGAYIALLLGYLIIDNEEYELFVRGHMPNKNYQMLLSVLQKFYNFMTLTAAAGAGSSRGIKATERLIKQLNEIDKAISSPPEGAEQQSSS